MDARHTATFQFRQACQLIGRPDTEIGQLLGAANGREPVSRSAVISYRQGTTDVPGWVLISATRLAGIQVTREMPSGPPIADPARGASVP